MSLCHDPCAKETKGTVRFADTLKESAFISGARTGAWRWWARSGCWQSYFSGCWFLWPDVSPSGTRDSSFLHVVSGWACRVLPGPAPSVRTENLCATGWWSRRVAWPRRSRQALSS